MKAVNEVCASGHNRRAINGLACSLMLLAANLFSLGCGTTKSQRATEQMIVSDAVDLAVAEIDFRALSGETVYFDTQFIKNIKGVGFVNADYIISSLRQQMIAANCRLQEARDDADFIIEARVGTLGTNGNEVVYGVPANNALSTAASLVSSAPSVPTIPEVSFAKKDAQVGAKIAVFAYERATQQPVWQSGLSLARSKAQDIWVFGAGPFQRGSIYEGTQFAGSKLHIPKLHGEEEHHEQPPIAYSQQHTFPRVLSSQPPRQIETAGFEGKLPPVTEAADASSSGDQAPPANAANNQDE